MSPHVLNSAPSDEALFLVLCLQINMAAGKDMGGHLPGGPVVAPSRWAATSNVVPPKGRKG